MTSSTHRSSNNNWTYDINMRPDNSDGRAADIIYRSWVQIPLRAKVLKALVWRLHVRFPCSYAQTGLYLIYPKASSKIKEVCKIAVIKICNNINIHGRNTGAYVHMHTYIQAHARACARTRLILNLYCITSTSEMLSNVVFKFTCANCNKLKPEFINVMSL